MERVSELILRNAGRLGDGTTLLLNPPRDNCFSQLGQSGREVRLFSQDFGDFQWLSTNGAEVEFGTLPPFEKQLENIILVQPRERERLVMMLHALAANMPATGRFWLVGEIRTGIKSAAKKLGLHFEVVTKLDNARHCVLFEAFKPRPLPLFDLSNYEKSRVCSIGEKPLEIKSVPGTFAHGKLDQGTELLLEVLKEKQITGRVLDFACGNGIIGLFLLGHSPGIKLTLLDASALAIESSRRSLRANRLEARVLASDGLDEVTQTFDWIISNPPFHRGVDSDLDIAARFFANAGHFLTKTGKILLVCNHHLPYARWLRSNFKHVEIIKASPQFKVIMAGRTAE
jgi:16S rRNA (guanine1207-N2)-methyltransferase